MKRVRTILCLIALAALLWTGRADVGEARAKFSLDPWPGWPFYNLA